MSFHLQLRKLTDDQRKRFYVGFTEAGGPEAVSDDPCPWACPWLFEAEIEVTGTTPEDWGTSWWLSNQKEIESLLEEEAENEE